MSSNIGTVTQAAADTGEAAGQVLQSSAELNSQADVLGEEVEKFLIEVKKL